jgi:hypothetical protein
MPHPKSAVSPAFDDLTKLGGLVGVFFFLQASGYAFGGGRTAPQSIIHAVALGTQHLSHIFVPFTHVAWPLGPVLCGLLIVYALHLPTFLGEVASQPQRRSSFDHFVGLLIGITLTSGVGGMWTMTVPWLFKRFVEFQEVIGKPALSGVYALSLLLYWKLSLAYVTPAVRRLVARQRYFEAPRSVVVTAIVIAWLMLLAFIGSRFDGVVDEWNRVFVY